MPRYFIEVAYKGTNYSGFQIQQNANTIQAEVEKALNVLFKHFPASQSGEELGVRLTGSSRTDAGVHAHQNFFHFDTSCILPPNSDKSVKSLNAILPSDIAVRSLIQVPVSAHCRFDAIYRVYKYYIYQQKNPFLQDRAFFYPYPINYTLLKEAADEIKKHQNFMTFSKGNTQVKTFICDVLESKWELEGGQFVYTIVANRFLRGMVKGIVGTMLQVGRKKITIPQLQNIIYSKDNTKADFAVPSHGLFLAEVKYKNF